MFDTQLYFLFSTIDTDKIDYGSPFLLFTGMALKLYDATPGQDEYQKAGFGAVLITVSVLCVVLGLGSIVVSTPCLRESVMKCLKRGQRKKGVHPEKVKVVVENGGVEMTRKAEI